MLDAFGLCVLGELGASRFPGPKRVRAKDAKDAKVRKGIAEMSLFHMGIDHEWARIFTNGEGRGNGRDGGEVARGVLFAEGVPGSVSPATTESAGGVAYRLEGGMKDLFLFLRVQTHHA